jgi:hypothetical protein
VGNALQSPLDLERYSFAIPLFKDWDAGDFFTAHLLNNEACRAADHADSVVLKKYKKVSLEHAKEWTDAWKNFFEQEIARENRPD